MPLNVCPITIIHRPAEQVWALLERPEAFDSWWEAKIDSIVPPGPASPGQEVYAHARALGRNWPIHIHVVDIDPERFQLELKSSFPFGISLHNHLKVTAVDAESAQVSFG